MKVSKGMQSAVDYVASMAFDHVVTPEDEKTVARVLKGKMKGVPGAEGAWQHWEDLAKARNAISAVAKGPGKHTPDDLAHVTSMLDRNADPALTRMAKDALTYQKLGGLPPGYVIITKKVPQPDTHSVYPQVNRRPSLASESTDWWGCRQSQEQRRKPLAA